MPVTTSTNIVIIPAIIPKIISNTAILLIIIATLFVV